MADDDELPTRVFPSRAKEFSRTTVQDVTDVEDVLYHRFKTPLTAVAPPVRLTFSDAKLLALQYDVFVANLDGGVPVAVPRDDFETTNAQPYGKPQQLYKINRKGEYQETDTYFKHCGVSLYVFQKNADAVTYAHCETLAGNIHLKGVTCACSRAPWETCKT